MQSLNTAISKHSAIGDLSSGFHIFLISNAPFSLKVHSEHECSLQIHFTLTQDTAVYADMLNGTISDTFE